MTKDTPMKRPEQTARMIPTILYMGGRPFLLSAEDVEEAVEVEVVVEVAVSSPVVVARAYTLTAW